MRGDSLWPPRLRPMPVRVADEMARVLARLADDRLHIIGSWSRDRDRVRLLDALQTHWHSVEVDELLALAPEQMDAVTRFHDELARIRLWALATEVMPATLERRLDELETRLTELAEAAYTALEHHPEPPADPWAPPPHQVRAPR